MLVLVLVRSMPVRADEAVRFVGAQVCAGCHAAEAQRWAGSHHALAMQKATPATVLGNFADAKVNHFGVVTRFSRSGDRFLVHTDGPDGALHDYEIAYTFGLYPLQQYLIALPGGRLQALGIAWDAGRRSRAASAGSISTRTSGCRPATACTGPDAIRRGTTNVPTATPPV